jgi:hypothetical protein
MGLRRSQLLFNPSFLQRLVELQAEEFSTVIRVEHFDFTFCVMLPQVLDDSPCIKPLILSGKQLNVKQVRVVVEEDDKVKFSVGGPNGEWST